METVERTSKVKHDAAKGVTEDGKIEITYNHPKYPDFEEFCEAAGTPEAGLEFVNVAVRDDAASKMRDFVTDQGADVSIDEIVRRTVTYMESYSPTPRITNRAKAAELDSLLAAFRENQEVPTERLMELAARL